MRKNLQSLAQLCARPLNDDPALRLEIEQELEDHLEDAFDEECSNGKSESEAEETAKQRFGDPEKLSQSLLDANRKRLKLRARVRRIVKIALIPAILAGITLCIDVRTLSGIAFLDLFGARLSFSSSPKIVQTIFNYETRNLDRKDRNFISQNLNIWNSGNSEWEQERYQSSPENRIYTARYALALAKKPSAKTQAEFRRILAHGRKIDPDNALYDYLEAEVILTPARAWDNTDNRFSPKSSLHITNRAAFDRGMKLYLAGLQKPFVKTYAMEIPAEIQRLINPDKDFLGLLEKLCIVSCTKLSFLSITRNLVRESAFYGETLWEEGKTKEATKYFNSWRKFLSQMLKFPPDTLIEVLVDYDCIQVYHDFAEKRGDSAEAKKLGKIRTILEQWKKQKGPTGKEFREHAGLLSAMLLPALHKEIPAEDFVPERCLTYLVGDIAGLAILSLLLTLLIFVFGIGALVSRLAGRRPFLVLLPLKFYGKILLWGILVPVAVFLLYTHLDFLGGRGNSLQTNLPRWIFGMAGMIFLFPFVFEEVFGRGLRKQAKMLGFKKGKLPFATACLNRMFAFAALLLIVGGILRPTLNWECRYDIARDTQFNTARGFTQIENQVTNELAAKLKRAIADADKTR